MLGVQEGTCISFRPCLQQLLWVTCTLSITFREWRQECCFLLMAHLLMWMVPGASPYPFTFCTSAVTSKRLCAAKTQHMLFSNYALPRRVLITKKWAKHSLAFVQAKYEPVTSRTGLHRKVNAIVSIVCIRFGCKSFFLGIGSFFSQAT